MGLLLKIILFGLVFYYLLKTIGSFVFRILGGQTQQNHYRQATHQKREGEINIDYVPENEKRRRRSGSKDGEYIDYEEIK